MTKEQGDATKVQAGIRHMLDDPRFGRRSVRWLAEQSGISYSTLQGKLSQRPASLTLGELFRIADALGCDISDLYYNEAA